MGRCVGVLVLTMTLCLTLTCCGGEGGSQAEQLALDIRGEYLAMSGCAASMEVTADYGQRVYEYSVDLTWQREGESVLTLTAPENVAGVTARLTEGETALDYDGVRVETGPLDDTGLSPVSAVPVLLDYATSPPAAWRPWRTGRCCGWTAGTRRGRRAPDGNVLCGLTRIPTPSSGESCPRTAIP